MAKHFEKGPVGTKVQELLRPNQVENTKAEIERLEYTISQPEVQDKATVKRQLENLKQDLHESAPRAYSSDEVDKAVKREAELREELIANGMPTAAEMRRNPAGAVSKHSGWEKRNKGKINEWKHIRQRLYAGSNDSDISNVETFRPTGGAQELNMDNCQIVAADFHLPPPGAGMPVTFSGEEKAQLAELDQELADSIAVLNNNQRAKVKDFLVGLNDPAPAPKKRKARGPLTPEHKKAMAEGRRKAAERRKAQEAAQTG